MSRYSPSAAMASVSAQPKGVRTSVARQFRFGIWGTVSMGCSYSEGFNFLFGAKLALTQRKRRRPLSPDGGAHRCTVLDPPEVSQPHGPEAGRVADHAHGGQGHGSGGNDRREQDPEDRIEHPGRNRHAQRIVDEG